MDSHAILTYSEEAGLTELYTLEREDLVDAFIETEAYAVFQIRSHLSPPYSLIYRKKDGMFFHFAVTGASGEHLFVINKTTSEIEIIEISEQNEPVKTNTIPFTLLHWKISKNGYIWNYSNKEAQIFHLEDNMLVEKYRFNYDAFLRNERPNWARFVEKKQNGEDLKVLNLNSYTMTNLGDSIDSRLIADPDYFLFRQNNQRKIIDSFSNTIAPLAYVWEINAYPVPEIIRINHDSIHFRVDDTINRYSIHDDEVMPLAIFPDGFLNCTTNTTDYWTTLFKRNTYAIPGIGRALLYRIDDDGVRLEHDIILSWINPNEHIAGATSLNFYGDYDILFIYPVFATNIKDY